MDRRVLFAFVLIGIVILLTPQYQEWLMGKDPQKAERVDSSYPDVSEEIVAVPRPKKIEITEETHPPEEKDVSVDEREIVVENDLFISRWSTRGGALKSWILKGYLDGKGGKPVDLVEEGGVGCVVTVGDHDLSDVMFDPGIESLSLSGDETATVNWSVKWKNSTIEKSVSVVGNRYDLEVDVRVRGELSDRKCTLEWRGGLGRGEQNYEDELNHTRVVTFMGGEVESWDVEEARSDQSRPSGQGGWVGLRSKYFLVAFVPEIQGRYAMKVVEETADPDRGKRFDIGIIGESQKGFIAGRVYGGPISYSILSQYEGGLQQAMSWGWDWARGLMEPIGIGILKIFMMIHVLVSNYGLVIILFSILVKIALYPLTHKSYESMARMQEVQPQITELREKYPKDQQRVNQEMMRLYKEKGVNPLGGCMPMLFQMPILFALFNVFQNAIELRQAPFVLWIDDLSQPEGIQVHVLPLMMALTMFFQQKKTLTDPKQKMMVYMMPAMMIFFFWGMSSGLVLYWTMFNLLSWGQQLMIEQVKKRSKK